MVGGQVARSGANQLLHDGQGQEGVGVAGVVLVVRVSQRHLFANG